MVQTETDKALRKPPALGKKIYEKEDKILVFYSDLQDIYSS
jgi:hypothetical protein